MKTQFAEPGIQENQFRAHRSKRLRPSYRARRTILLISDDKPLYENLRAFANTAGQMVVRTEHAAGTVAVLRVTRPTVVLLDLDLPDEAAWEAADLLLQEPICPPVILLTGRIERFDMRTAIQAGSLVRKGESPSRLLEIVEEALEMPQINQAERNTIQRVLIRWLKPFEWGASNVPAYRFWGINE
jgi:DNA-binding response OmpR family regulator